MLGCFSQASLKVLYMCTLLRCSFAIRSFSLLNKSNPASDPKTARTSREMAAKRLHSPSESDPEKLPGEKRLRTAPSFPTVIKEAMMVKSFQNLCSGLEPLLRRVVKEEVELGIAKAAARTLHRSPSLQLESSEASSLQLVFTKKLSLPIFTGTKIQGIDNTPLQIRLIDTKDGSHAPVVSPSAIKVEIIALDGDFPGNDVEDWTSDQFKNKIVRAREGKRPLLTGDVYVTLRDGVATIDEVEFTDNSSWIRSRTFRLGAQVATGSSQGVRIKEAMTEAFAVKDHRGELYKKNHPPSLGDDVWRLERIGKDGAFHRKLAAQGIKNVQHFLKMYYKDEDNLRKILGVGMSDKMWEGTIKHAVTCELGNKRYLYQQGQHSAILLNPVCQVICAWINGQVVPAHTLSGLQKSYVQRMAMEAYERWETLEEVDEINTPINPNTTPLRNDSLLLPGDVHQQPLVGSPDFGCIIPSNNMQLDYGGSWALPRMDSSDDDSNPNNDHNARLLYDGET